MTSMTRQHFELIAKIFKDDYQAMQNLEVGDLLTVKLLAESFASALADTNPNFNRNRFLTACGINQD